MNQMELRFDALGKSVQSLTRIVSRLHSKVTEVLSSTKQPPTPFLQPHRRDRGRRNEHVEVKLINCEERLDEDDDEAEAEAEAEAGTVDGNENYEIGHENDENDENGDLL
jgi:hypothetical protein